MTRIKVCGITNLDDAHAAIDLGVDAIGLVFAPSKRQVDPDNARNIVQRIAPFATTVGVFMDENVDEVRRIASYTGIDVVQLHGSEPTVYCERLDRRVIKRIKITSETTTGSLLTRMNQYYVSAFLLDPGSGSGRTFDWRIAEGISTPIIIAGGLNPDNVGDVVRALHPYGVDVSSGVEKTPGTKDPEKIRSFIREVRQCS